MTEGITRIHLSHKEPNKELLWLRPRLDREGYDLLYWGSNGWTPLIDCQTCPHKKHPVPHYECINRSPVVDEDALMEIPDETIPIEGRIYELTPPSINLPETPKPPCGCPDVTIKQM